MLEAIVLLGVPALLLLWGIVIYNRFIRLRALVREGWSGIDVQLKRRADLIPNLVSTVQGYKVHEDTVLTKVTELRAQTLGAKDPEERARAEGALSTALANLFAVAENYPELKASRNFTDLQGQLGEIEDQIQSARRYYNGTVRNFNILVASFPSNLVAGVFRFTRAQFFELDKAADRAVPEVQF
ncbi:MAG: LemA family protein [Alphaproteobacteria bacterium]|nr:LemA family protein [Alphaproteobacteria bacterium]